MGHPTALQGQVAAFCRARELNAEFGAALDFAVRAKAAAITASAWRGHALPDVQKVPTRASPFVFLHHEKTAGSSLRRYIAQAARRVGAPFYVPCYDKHAVYHEDFRCYSFDVANASAANGGENRDLAAIAGHFQWGVWRSLESNRADPPPCFTMVRHPVDRAIQRSGTARSDFGSRAFEARSSSRGAAQLQSCLLYTSPSPRDQRGSRMPSSA